MPIILADLEPVNNKFPTSRSRSNSAVVPRERPVYRRGLVLRTARWLVFAPLCALVTGCSWSDARVALPTNVATVAGQDGAFGEPFGIAVRDGAAYLSDGDKGVIWKIDPSGNATQFAVGLDTPSAIEFDKDGRLLVADSGANSIVAIDTAGTATTVASGLSAPVGIAVAGGRVFVADSYSDRIGVIENGSFRSLSTSRGFADGTEPKFDTPLGLASWGDKVLVADAGNRRIRVLEPDGSVWTLAGNGEEGSQDGTLLSASFVEPTALLVRSDGTIFVADGNAIRVIGGGVIPMVRTLNGDAWRGFADGKVHRSRFNRISGLAFDANGDLLVADSDNRLVRKITTGDPAKSSAGKQAVVTDAAKPPSVTAQQFRSAAPGRWPYDPPTAKRDIAGTMGEIRGQMTEAAENVWFHNGLDVAGSYGETARFVRSEKVLAPDAAENFGTLRELIRMPTMGYIHIRLGRAADGTLYPDKRFIFEKDGSGKLVGVRVPRGTKFEAGEPIGTLNPMNHVHLIAGRAGQEINALDALELPGYSDSRPPKIESAAFTYELGETIPSMGRIVIDRKTRLVMRAYDQVDGNNERRRLGLYKAGYQLMTPAYEPLNEPKWNIVFDQMPSNAAVKYAYAAGSYSGATGTTIFDYIVSNRVNGSEYSEGYFDPTPLAAGVYVLRFLAADQAGNVSSFDVQFEVKK